MTRNLLRWAMAAVSLPLLGAADDAPVQLNPKAVVYDLPAQIPWHEVSAIPGLKIANLVGTARSRASFTCR